MTRFQFSKQLAVLFLALLFTLPAFAAKRRAIGPTPDAKSKITGVVTDVATGQPVRFADITVGADVRTQTDGDGKFEIEVPTARRTAVQVARSGYATAVVALEPGQTTLNISLRTSGVARVRTTDNRNFDLDIESSQFAYLIPFSGYSRKDFGNFCTAGNAKFEPHRSEIRRVIGPAVPVTNAECCSRGPVMKATLELKTGETREVFFNDSCFGFEVDFVGRDHTTGEFIFLRFTEIAEIVFP